MIRIAIKKEHQEDVRQAGDYCIFDLSHSNDGIKFCCPHDGCGDITHLPLKPLNRGWSWNESENTLSPSIQRMDKDRCNHHFSLIKGEWVP